MTGRTEIILCSIWYLVGFNIGLVSDQNRASHKNPDRNNCHRANERRKLWQQEEDELLDFLNKD